MNFLLYPERRVILLSPPSQERVLSHNVENTIRLRQQGYNIPSPIGYYYGWPRDKKLIPHPMEKQIETSGFLTLNQRAYCLNSIGTGKTLSALWASDYLMTEQVIRKVLIVSPLSTLERVWGDSIFFHLRHRTCAVLHGTAAKRRQLFLQPHDYYVVNHDGFELLCRISKDAKGQRKVELLRDDIDMVIVDELAVYRNSQTDKHAILKAALRPTTWVWGLTGTPIPNAPTDAWAQCRLLTPQTVPGYFTSFKNQTMQQVTMYKWVPRKESLEIVYKAMKPAVRFAREEVFTLPGELHTERSVEMTKDQKKHYQEMLKELYTEINEGKVTAVNEGVKILKLLQVACLSGETEVLTCSGWKRIISVNITDRVWDGEEWVTHAGVVYRGESVVTSCAGLSITPDHQLLTTTGWATVEEINHGESSEKFTRAAVRLPDSDCACGDKSGAQADSQVAMSLCLRKHSYSRESVSPHQAPGTPTKLWLSSWKRVAQALKYANVFSMGWYAAAVPQFQRQRLSRLGRAWSHYLQKVARLLCRFLPGYERGVSAGPNYWANKQQRFVHAKELSLGDTCSTGRKPAHQPHSTDAKRPNECDSSSTRLWDREGDVVCSVEPRVVTNAGSSIGTIAVYDLLECGPRNRFVVRGETGELSISHNCGVVYDKTGVQHEIDCKPRVATVLEVIEEAGEKVLVFAPFTGSVHMLHREISKHWTCEMVYGKTSPANRNRIFSAFQDGEHPHVIVADAGCMSHGLTLTEANTIIWYAPTTSNEEYVQANGRITRAGQTTVANIVHIESTVLERAMYKRLKDKTALQGLLLDMVRDGGLR